MDKARPDAHSGAFNATGVAAPKRGTVEDFAAWLTTRPGSIKVGAGETVYAMIDALAEYEALGDDKGRKITKHAIDNDFGDTVIDLATVDARVWFEGWRTNVRMTGSNPFLNDGYMLGWFANAIEAGRTAGFKDAGVDRFLAPTMIFDALEANNVELIVDPKLKVWVNVDGVCVVRVGKVETVAMDKIGEIVTYVGQNDAPEPVLDGEPVASDDDIRPIQLERRSRPIR
jgi:hypothetical protein